MRFSVIACIVLILFFVVASASASDLNDARENINMLDNISSKNLESSIPSELNSYGADYSSDEDDNAVILNDSTFQNNLKQTFLSGNDVELYFQNGTAYKVVLSDNDGNLLANQRVLFDINGINYTRTTNNDGVASIIINLRSGNYNITSYYVGTDGYESSSTSNVVKVLSTIYGEDIEKYYRNGTQYYATFVNGQGALLKNTTVVFNINGVFYERKTNENGIAKLNINLNPAEYVITATNLENGEMKANTITVLPTIYADDITKYFKNATQYYATFVNEVGDPLKYTNITFNINGVFYTRTTNDKGIAKLNINLEPNTYIITAINSNDGYLHSNNIVVLPTISADDLYMSYKNDKFTAHVIDNQGNPLANSTVTFNINGVFYDRVSNSEGDARLNINLDVGTYIITSTDEKGLSVSNIITIKKGNTIISGDDAYIILGTDRDYTVTLTGRENAKPIVGAEIHFKYGGVVRTAITDDNGEATVTISDFSIGTYSISYGFDGNANYYADNGNNKFVVANPTVFLFADDLDMIYNDGSKFNVILTDSALNPMTNKSIRFTINGVNYNRTTDNEGVAGLTVNLNPGIYTIDYCYSVLDSIDYNEGSNTIIVNKIPARLITEDLVMESDEHAAFTALLVDEMGNALNNTGTVTFTINGISYSRTTNGSGVAKLNINLPVGYYDITTSFDNAFYAASSKYNHILVDGYILIAYDISLFPKLYRDYSVTLVDAYGIPVVNADIEFKYNGITKHAKTDSDGIATISVGDLSIGDYLIIYKYADGDIDGQSHIFVSESVLNTKNTISNLAPYLSSSKNCPVSNAEIVALAKRLTEKFSNPLDKAIAIYEYVRDEISYDYYYDTYYGAVGTLHAKMGNCVDQSHLSIALYRAAGFPARYVHGYCVFNDGDASGHVWAQVLVGDTWIVSDSINVRNSLGKVTNWNNYNYKLYGYYSSISF